MHRCNIRLGIPSLTTGNGNCLFNAVSIALTGGEHLANELRLRTAIEMIQNANSYTSRSDYDELLNYSPDYEDSVKACCTDREYSSIWTILALSTVIGIPIQSVYPKMNGEHDHTHSVLTKLLNNTENEERDSLAILWTSSGPRTNRNWIANHFVPILQQDVTTERKDSLPSPKESTPVTNRKRPAADFTLTDELGGDFKIRKVQMSDLDGTDYPIILPDIKEDDTPTPTTDDSVINSLPNTNNCNDHEDFSPPLNVKTLNKLHSASEAYNLISSHTGGVESQVPAGNKSDCYFLVDNSENVSNISKNRKCTFFDDCGVWDHKKGNSVKISYLKDGNELTVVESKNSVYCVKKQENGKKTWKVLSPQPSEDNIIIMNRYYATLKRSPHFKKRVTFFVSQQNEHLANVALYEYTGTLPPESQPHGNAKSGNTYTRTNPSTMNNIKRTVNNKKPSEVYYALKHDDSSNCPRDYRVIRNAKQRARKEGFENKPVSNVADEILEVIAMLQDHPFVQTIIHHKDEVPSVICYTIEQLEDLKYFLKHNKDQPIGIDRTFNLGQFYVTTLVYKNTRLLKKDTQANPIFIGPILLHKEATYKTYKSFLEHVETALDLDINNVQLRLSENMIFGSDDEKALTKAIDQVFPDATRMLCTKHLRENVQFYLQSKVGTERGQRQAIVNSIFGADGLLNADTTIEFETRSQQLETSSEQLPAFQNYYRTRLKPRLEKYVFEPRRKVENKQWTNNNAESINNVFKLAVDWKPQRTKELILKLYSVVSIHYMDYRSALHGHGNYQLVRGEQQYQVHDSIWRCKSEEEKRRLFMGFLRDAKRKVVPKYITSKDGRYSVINKAKGAAKKPGQRRRPKNERTRNK